MRSWLAEIPRVEGLLGSEVLRNNRENSVKYTTRDWPRGASQHPNELGNGSGTRGGPMPTTVAEAFAAVGLKPEGVVRWGEPLTESARWG